MRAADGGATDQDGKAPEKNRCTLEEGTEKEGDVRSPAASKEEE